jgi:hypothetical protein
MCSRKVVSNFDDSEFSLC